MRICRECTLELPDDAFYPRRLVCKTCFHKARGSQPIGRPRNPVVTHMVCTRCGQTKPIAEVRKNSYKTKSPLPICLACDAAQRAIRIDQAAQRNLHWLLGYLAEHPCADCGETDPLVLDFDHDDPATKHVCVSALLSTGSRLERLQAEVAKCTVRCANCHRRKHARGRKALLFGVTPIE